MAATFRAGGLASGLDTNSIIDSLMALEQRPLDLLKKQQSAFKTQVSTLGDIISRLGSLKSTVTGLSDTGVLGVKASTENDAFTAVPGSSAVAGRFSIGVTTLATAGQARSVAFSSSSAAVKGGTLDLTVQGTTYNLTIDDGTALSDVALAIRNSGAPVSATVLNDGTNSYLSITNRETGYPIGGTTAQGLTVTHTATGSTGTALGFSINTTPANAVFTIDGLTFTRKSNTVTDALTGTTLTLKETTATNETLQLDNDVDATAANLQRFVDNYNGVLKQVQAQLAVSKDTARQETLAGDSAIRSLQRSLQSMITTTVGSGSVRTLADLGITTARDGSLSINKTTLGTAITNNAAAVNTIFSTATTGLTDRFESMIDTYTNIADGVLVSRKNGLNRNITSMDDQILKLGNRLESTRQNMINQFTAMEKVISQLRATGNFLSQQQFGLAK